MSSLLVFDGTRALFKRIIHNKLFRFARTGLLLAVLASAQARAEPPRTADGSQMSGELRTEIKQYLQKEFRREGISEDLLALVFTQMEGGTSYDFAVHPEYPAARSYPSIAQQINWQHDLNKIAADVRKKFPSLYKPNRSVRVIDDAVVDQRPGREIILWRLPIYIERAQGAFSENFKRWNPQRISGVSGKTVTDLAWLQPMKLALTGNAVVDERIRDSVRTVASKAQKANSVIKILKPNDLEANAFIPSNEFGASSVEKVGGCLSDRRCDTMREIAFRVGYEAAPDTKGSQKDFLRRLYLTNPYGRRNSSSALLEANLQGQIMSAFCGHGDIGYSSLRSSTTFHPNLLSYCIGQMFDPALSRLP